MMERAREIDAMLLERRPSDPWLLMALGWTNWYRRTLEARPAFSNAHAELAYVALAQGLDEVARRHLEDHRAAEVDEPRYYNRIGGVALFLGEDDLARDYYLQSLATSRDIRNRPRGRYTQTALGYLSWKAGDLDAARDLLAESERMSCVLLAGGADG